MAHYCSARDKESPIQGERVTTLRLTREAPYKFPTGGVDLQRMKLASIASSSATRSAFPLVQ
jgi:hypothetical protein